jgi:hypothetical protein
MQVTIPQAKIDGRNVAVYIKNEHGIRFRVPVMNTSPLTINVPEGFLGRVQINDGLEVQSYDIDTRFHPWLDDLRTYVKLLNNEISLPHLVTSCDECLKAYEAKRRFFSESINAIP